MINIINARPEGQSFEEYKREQREANKLLAAHLKVGKEPSKKISIPYKPKILEMLNFQGKHNGKNNRKASLGRPYMYVTHWAWKRENGKRIPIRKAEGGVIIGYEIETHKGGLLKTQTKKVFNN